MQNSRRRIDQIKAKLDVLDKSISAPAKPSAVNLVELINAPEPKLKTTGRLSAMNSRQERTQTSGGPGSRFYEEAKAHMEGKQRMEEEVAKGYKHLANKKKLTENSAMILSERLNTNIAIAILNADGELTKQLRFEQVGKVLTDLRMFSVIAFNDQFECKINSGAGGGQ